MRKIKLQIRIERDAKAALEVMAERDHRTVSDFIRYQLDLLIEFDRKYRQITRKTTIQYKNSHGRRNTI